MNTQPRNDRNLLSEFVVRVRLHEGHLVCLWLGLVASHLSLSLSLSLSLRQKRKEAVTHPQTISVKRQRKRKEGKARE